MLILFDNPFSTNAQKVRLVLAEKGLAFESRILDLQKGDQFDPEFKKVNPNAQVPALVDEGETFVESTVICEYLDDKFPDPPLKPSTAKGRARMRWQTEQTVSWISHSINSLNVGLVFRVIYRSKTPEEMQAFFDANPNPIAMRRQKSLVKEGVNSPLIPIALKRYRRLIKELDASLQETGPWLAGEEFSLADTGLVPYLHRLDVMGFGVLHADRPAYTAWLERMRERPSFVQEITDKLDPEAVAFHQKCVEESREELDKIFADPELGS